MEEEEEKEKEEDRDEKSKPNTQMKMTTTVVNRQPTSRKVSVQIKPPEIRTEYHHAKNTLFARVKIIVRENGEVAKLSRGDNETVQLIKHHLQQQKLEQQATDGVDKKNEDVDEDQEELFDPEATFLLIDRWPYFLISHDSEFKGHWETMIICLVLFQAMQAPFETSFADLGMGLACDVFMMVIFIIDFLHNFLTTYSDRNGNTVINGEEIVKTYINTVWFWIDFISSIPYDAFTSNDSSSTSNFKVMKLLRLARMTKILKKVDSITKAGTIRLLRLLIGLLLFFHWTACGWWGVGRLWFCRLKGFDLIYLESSGAPPHIAGYTPSSPTGPSVDHISVSFPHFNLFNSSEWARDPTGLKIEDYMCNHFTENRFADEGWDAIFEAYVASFYQASTTLMGSGGAYTSQEQLFFAFVTIIGAALQAIVFGSVAVILASADEDAVTFQKKMLKINHRMAYLNMPLEMQERVRGYYQKMWDTERSLTTDPDAFISEVSKPLGADIKMRLYQNLLVKVTFLQNLNDIVVEELVKSLKTSLYLEGDLIMRKGESGNWMGLIGKGQVAVLSPVDGKIIRIMENGDYLGEMALLYRVNRTVDIRALAWVSMLILSSEDLARIKEDYPEDIFALEEELESMMIAKQYKHVEVESDEDSDLSDSDSEGGDKDDDGEDDVVGSVKIHKMKREASIGTKSSNGSRKGSRGYNKFRSRGKALRNSGLPKKAFAAVKAANKLARKQRAQALENGEEEEEEISDEELYDNDDDDDFDVIKSFSSNKLMTGRNINDIAKILADELTRRDSHRANEVPDFEEGTEMLALSSSTSLGLLTDAIKEEEELSASETEDDGRTK